MNVIEKRVLDKFKVLILKRLNFHKIILFGSRARGDAEEYSDMDVVVILDDTADDLDFDYVSDCAWEAGFNDGIVIVPIIFTRDKWENSPEHYSLLAQAVKDEGVQI